MEPEAYERAKLTAELDAYESISRPVGTSSSGGPLKPRVENAGLGRSFSAFGTFLHGYP